jgi:VWFA-related protein
MRGRLALGLLLTAGSTFVVAQTQRPVFRPKVVLVPVDVRVLDEHGALVRNLEARNFSIFEDGRRQEIAFFEKTAPADSVAARSDTARTFLIALGRGRLQGPSKGLQSLIQFVRHDLSANDRIGVVAYDRVSELTTHHEQVAAFLERYADQHEAIENVMANYFTGLHAMYWDRVMPADLQTKIDRVFEGPALPAFRRLPRLVAPDDEAYRRERDEILADRDRAEERMATLIIKEQDLDNLYTSVEVLRFLPGEKHVIFVAGQPPEGITLKEAERFATLASDGRVSVSLLQVGGDPGKGWVVDKPGAQPRFDTRSFPQLFALEAFRSATRITGGAFSAYEYADNALSRIDDRTRSGYVLAYYPSQDSSDGKLRKITVAVDRKGLTVSHRQFYLAAEGPSTAELPATMARDRIGAAFDDWRDFHDIGVTVEAAVKGSELEVNATIDPASLGNSEVPSSFFVGITADRSRTKVLARFQDRIDVGIDWRIHKLLPIKTPVKGARVKIVIYDQARDRIGSATVKLK